MSWEIPAPIYCPACGSVMRIVEEGDVKKYVCTKRTCGHVVAAPSEPEGKEEA